LLRELIRKYETFIEKYQKTPAVPYGNDLNMGHSDEAKGVSRICCGIEMRPILG
jgi:hypothetical protein